LTKLSLKIEAPKDYLSIKLLSNYYLSDWKSFERGNEGIESLKREVSGAQLLFEGYFKILIENTTKCVASLFQMKSLTFTDAENSETKTSKTTKTSTTLGRCCVCWLNHVFYTCLLLLRKCYYQLVTNVYYVAYYLSSLSPSSSPSSSSSSSKLLIHLPDYTSNTNITHL